MIVHGEGEKESWLMHAYDLHFNIIIAIIICMYIAYSFMYTSVYSGTPL